MKKWQFVQCILLVSLALSVFGVATSFAENPLERNDNLNYAWIGDTIKFGSYEQDYNEENGKEAIEWLVLEVQDEKALLLSKYALDCVQFHSENIAVTWDDSMLREWLNSVFIENTFSDAEKKWILDTEVTAQQGTYYGVPVNPGEDTIDRVFLMSEGEYWRYYRNQGMDKGICPASKYCIAQGAKIDMEGNSEWWLRSPAGWSEQNTITCVSASGSSMENQPNNKTVGVRPAMWIKLNSAIMNYLTTPIAMIHCPECGEWIKADSFSCILCGTLLEEFSHALAAQQFEKASNAIDSYYSDDEFLTYGQFQSLLRNFTDSVLPEVKYYADTTAIKIGNWRLSPAELTMYYNEAYTMFVDSYGEYAELIGLDTDSGITGLLEQACPFENFETWQAYFMDVAIENLRIYSVMLAYAEEKDIALPEEEMQELEIYCSEVLEELATEEGYLSVEEMLAESCGIGYNADSLKIYILNDRLVNTVYNHLWEEFSAIAQQEEEVDSSVSTEADLILEKMREWVDTNTKELAVEFFPFFKIAGHFPKTQE